MTALATVVSTLAYVITALYIRAELKALEKERFLTVTSELFSVWQSKDFMEAQLWLLYRLAETTWDGFIRAHRADFGEVCFHRVGSYYDRVGTLIRMELVNETEILSTIGAHAIAVWNKIEPLVREARAVENSILFDDFERMLPACYECYVPSLGPGKRAEPFSTPPQPPKDGSHIDSDGDDRSSCVSGTASSTQPVPYPTVDRGSARRSLVQPGKWSGPDRPAKDAVPRTTPKTLARILKRQQSVTVLDSRRPDQVDKDPRVIPGAIWIPLQEIQSRLSDVPEGKPVVVYCG